ncbi:MAG TPA: N-acetyl-gamma-glutamyl-phosphate reductase [Candidatus Tumulicola sp.]
MTRVHVWGSSGYAAAETIRLLSRHPEVELTTLESRSHAGESAGDHFTALRNLPFRFDGPGSVLASVRRGDVVIAAGNAGDARTFVPECVARGARTIDLSSDFRLDASAAYGLPEWNRASIATADIVANPGCYPTATALGMLPLAGIGSMRTIVIDAKSGVSGAGRMPRVDTLFAEVSGDVRPYALAGHRHQTEIERILGERGVGAAIVFTPHVVPIVRGMLVDAYAVFEHPVDGRTVQDAYARAYDASPFVRLVSGDRVPSLPSVVGTNDAELYVDVRDRVVRVVCAIDNLGKGAAGQAVQNLNVMLGYPEVLGLDARTVFC